MGALQGLDGYLLWHGALLDTGLQQPVAVPEQIPPRQVMSAEEGNKRETFGFTVVLSFNFTVPHKLTGAAEFVIV